VKGLISTVPKPNKKNLQKGPKRKSAVFASDRNKRGSEEGTKALCAKGKKGPRWE